MDPFHQGVIGGQTQTRVAHRTDYGSAACIVCTRTARLVD